MKIFYCLIVCCLPHFLIAQDFNYVHYDTKDGLAGSTVYNICQDNDGFMWFATENGLSRYDGTHFKNFTVKDGLPDNEVLKLFSDSKGRLWIGTFSKEICYYYKGKIYNKENDSLVRKIKMDAAVYSILEDKDHYLAMSAHDLVIIITSTGDILKYKIKDISGKTNEQGDVILGNNKNILFGNVKGDFFAFDKVNKNWHFIITNTQAKIISKENSFGICVVAVLDSVVSIPMVYLTFPGSRISHSAGKIFVKYINTTNGSWDIDTVHLQKGNHYLPNKKVTDAIEDREKNTWFSTLGEGVYKLPSKDVKTFQFSIEKNTGNNSVFSIVGNDSEIIAGLEENRAVTIDNKFNSSIFNYQSKELLAGVNSGDNRLYSIAKISNSIIMLGFDKFLVKLENHKPFFKYINPIKSVEKIDKDFIVVGTSGAALKIRLENLEIVDTIWRERCTKVFYQNNKYYIGTLKGLYEVNEDKTYTYLGNLNHALTRRITDIKNTAEGTLWIATSDNGIVALKDGKITSLITDSNGLSSNICKAIFIKGNSLWVGTDKGVNKVTLNGNKYDIVKYGTSDGLPSNVINSIYVKDSIVWIGSPAGLTYFNENNISSSSMCNLRMLSIYVSGKEIKMDSNLRLSYQNNNINFQYAGISFRSSNEITYYYKLDGLDTEWKTTTENGLDYKLLPAANYTLELYAVNKYGVKSNAITISFSVAAPFWKTIWFYLLLFIAAVVSIVSFFNWRNKKTKLRLEEKNRFQKQFAALEQQALQTQMNPHFIFNCLNSIQQYILTNDKEKANQYLTGFAALIRQTLDMSAEKSITVADEASYLKKYLQMEQMRYGDTFTYSITIAANADYIKMPALLLQPYVENCLRHGIRYMQGDTGKIEISFVEKEKHLLCTIKDNGVGRAKAAEFKSKQHIEYQSKGMSLTSKRIELLNTINESKITIAVIDLKNQDNSAAGTLVEINLPI